MKTYLEYQDEKSHKFWLIDIESHSHTVRYGKVDENGKVVGKSRTSTKHFDSTKEALQSAQKLIKKKVKKGYTGDYADIINFNPPENVECKPVIGIWMAHIHSAENGEETWHYWDKRGYLFVKMRYDRENHPIDITYFPPDGVPENSLYSASYDRWLTVEQVEAIKEAKNVDKNAEYNPVTEQWILPDEKERKQKQQQKQQKAEADRVRTPVYDVSHYEQVIPQGAHITYQEAHEQYKLASTSVDYGYQAYVIKGDVYIKDENDLKKLKAEMYRDEGDVILVVDGDLVVAGRVDDSFPLFVVQGDLRCESLILTDETISATIWGDTYVKHAIYYRDNALEMDFYGTTYTPYFFTDDDDRPLAVTLSEATIKINYDSNTRRYRRDVKYDYVKKDLPMVFAYEVFDFGYQFDIERFIDFVATGNNPIRETPLSKKALKPLMQQKLNDSIADIISDKNRTTLDLSNLNLKDIPEGVFELTQLEELIVSNNKIKKIPKAISQLKNLRVLDLSYNDNVNITAVGALTQLEVLNLKLFHASAVLPDELKNLKNLKKLDIWSGYFENIDVVSELESLETLSIDASNPPKNGKKLTKLETLNVLSGGDKLIDFALQLPALKHFKTSYLEALPDTFYQLTQLETLSLDSHSLQDLSGIGKLKNLKHLDLDIPALTTLPEDFFTLKNLQYLNIPQNSFSKELLDRIKKTFPQTDIKLKF